MKRTAVIVAALLVGVAIQLQASASPATLEDTNLHSLQGSLTGIPMCEGVQPEQVSATTWQFMLRNGFYSDSTDQREALYPMVCED